MTTIQSQVDLSQHIIRTEQQRLVGQGDQRRGFGSTVLALAGSDRGAPVLETRKSVEVYEAGQVDVYVTIVPSGEKLSLSLAG